MISHLFDTSAILAHYLNENGVDQVAALLRDNRGAGISVLSLVEFSTRLKLICKHDSESDRVFRLYARDILTCIPVSQKICEFAIELRANTRPRLPLVDAVIAATAGIENAILIHRDPHLAAINDPRVRQVLLSRK